MRKKQIYLFSMIPFLIGCQIKNDTLVLGGNYVNRRNIVFHIKCDKKQNNSVLINTAISHSTFFKDLYEPTFKNITVLREMWLFNSDISQYPKQKKEVLKINDFSSENYTHEVFSENPTYFADSFSLEEGKFCVTYYIQEYDIENIDKPSLYCPVLIIEHTGDIYKINNLEDYSK